ncbi:MAG: hypothetical protein V3V61_07155 [Gammaproteobacteria bacterium]
MTIYHILKSMTVACILSSSFIISTYAAEAVEEGSTDPNIFTAQTTQWLQQIFNYTFGFEPEVKTVPTRKPEPENHIQIDPPSLNDNWYDADFEMLPQTSDPTLQAIQKTLKSEEKCGGRACSSEEKIVKKIIGNADADLKAWLEGIDIPFSLSVRTLLEPQAYQQQPQARMWSVSLPAEPGTSEAAYDFIRYVTSGVTTFPQDIDFVNAVNRGGLSGDAKTAAAKYMAERYSYAALASVAIDNFYYLAEKRTPNKETDDKSIVEAEHDSIMQYDDQWRASLAGMPQKQVLEQIAILLVEQQKQSYLRGQENDRTLAALSASVLLKLQELKPQMIYDTMDIDTTQEIILPP